MVLKIKNEKDLNKIFILGSSGSGKTFLANLLSKKLNIPSYDLDDIFWYKKYTKKRAREIKKVHYSSIILSALFRRLTISSYLKYFDASLTLIHLKSTCSFDFFILPVNLIR